MSFFLRFACVAMLAASALPAVTITGCSFKGLQCRRVPFLARFSYRLEKGLTPLRETLTFMTTAFQCNRMCL